MGRFLIILAINVFCSSAFAEYRVFELKIVHVDEDTERSVLSTLDQYQYPSYHPVSLRERIDLVDHWLCPERTNGKELCPKPVPADEPTDQVIDQSLIPQG